MSIAAIESSLNELLTSCMLSGMYHPGDSDYIIEILTINKMKIPEDFIFYLEKCVPTDDQADTIGLLSHGDIAWYLNPSADKTLKNPRAAQVHFGFIPIRNQDGDLHCYSISDNTVRLFYFGDCEPDLYWPPHGNSSIEISESALLSHSPCLGDISRFLTVLANGDPYLDIVVCR